ncbi:MAG: hypothetical protein ACPGVN_06705, partial [Alphaproteobacteria bacterium]
TATFAGPNAPSLPTPFWLNNSVTPHVLHYWLEAPNYQYVPLGFIDPNAATFTPSGANGSGSGSGSGTGSGGTPATPMTVSDQGDGTYVFTPPNGGAAVTIREFDIDRLPNSNTWSGGDTLAKENAGGTEQEADADAYIADVLQSGPQSSAVLAALSTGGSSGGTSTPVPIEEISVDGTLPANPNAGDLHWLETGVAPNRVYQEQIYLNGAWQPTERDFDEASMGFVEPVPTAPTNPAVEEISVATSLPTSAVEGDIAWLEAGSTPNRTYAEYVYLNATWHLTGRDYDEASATVASPMPPVTPPVEEITVGNGLPTSAVAGDIGWLETGAAPNRVYEEHIYINGGWQDTGRDFDEASGAFVVPANSAGTGGNSGPVAVFYQQEPRGINGGDIPGGGWRDRVLNTEQYNGIPGLSLNVATGEMTFAPSAAARNFHIRGSASFGYYDYQQGFTAVHHQTRIASSGGIQQFVGDSCFACNSNGGPQAGNSTYANIEGVLTVPQGGGTYVFQHVNNWSFSGWDSKQGASVGHGMDLVSMTTLAGPEIYATLSVQEIA